MDASQNLITGIFQPQPGIYESVPVELANTIIALLSNSYFGQIPGIDTNQQPFTTPLTFSKVPGVPCNYQFTVSCNISAFQNTPGNDNTSLNTETGNIPDGSFNMFLSCYEFPNDISFNSTNSILIGSWPSNGGLSAVVYSKQIIYNSASKTYYVTILNEQFILENVNTNNTFYVGLYFTPNSPSVYSVGNTQSNYTNPLVTRSLLVSSDLSMNYPCTSTQLVSSAFYSLNPVLNPPTTQMTTPATQTLLSSLYNSLFLNQSFPNSTTYFSAIQNQYQPVLTIYNISERDVGNIKLPVAPVGYAWNVTNVIMFYILLQSNSGTYGDVGYGVIPTYVENYSTTSLYDLLTQYFNQLIITNTATTTDASLNLISFLPFNINLDNPSYYSSIGEQIDAITTQLYINATYKPTLSASQYSSKFFNITLQLVNVE